MVLSGLLWINHYRVKESDPYSVLFISGHEANLPLTYCKKLCLQIFLNSFTPKTFIIIIISHWYYLPTPPLGQDMTQGQFLSRV